LARFSLARGREDPYVSLRFRDFRRFVLGNFLASMGVQMQTVAVGWDLYERTGSALALGGVGLAQVAPIFALTLVAGHAVDRLPRKRILVAAQLLMACSSVGLAAASRNHWALLFFYAFLTLNGVGRAFHGPARDALQPQLLPVEMLANGATWRSGTFQLAAVIGPALGGAVIAAAHTAVPTYLLAAAGIVSFSFLVVGIRPRPFVPSRRAGTQRELVAGLRFLWQTRVLFAVITLDMFAVLLGGATMLLPVYAKDILKVGAGGLGWMLAAPACGALVMALVLAHAPPLQRAGRAMLMAVAGFGGATILFGLSRSFSFSLAMLVSLGAFDMVSIVIRSTLMQVLTPDELRGRVGAINSLFIGTSNELGGFESGSTAALFGPVASVVGGGVGSILVVLAVGLAWPEVWRHGPLETPAPHPS
jgi:MFS family permease